ncbi:MAG TPA: hypothetical protein VK616_05905 [Flavitalea sp.]|nr:hypothetical protein [Flavitalea sp.]
MSTFIKNRREDFADCNSENSGIIGDRITQENYDTSPITHQIRAFDQAKNESPDPRIRSIFRATSFPAADIKRMLNNENVSYIRIYNALMDDGQYITYAAPIKTNFESFDMHDPISANTICAPCCHCRPCLLDRLINPIMTR